MVRRLGASAAAVALKLKDLAPYTVIALVVPGGALMALLLWLYRRQNGPGWTAKAEGQGGGGPH